MPRHGLRAGLLTALLAAGLAPAARAAGTVPVRLAAEGPTASSPTATHTNTAAGKMAVKVTLTDVPGAHTTRTVTETIDA